MDEQDPFDSVGEAAVAGNYGAFSVDACKPGLIAVSEVGLFDLGTGAQVPDRGDETAFYHPAGSCGHAIDRLVLGSDAVSAVHVTELDPGSCSCMIEQVQASDRTGVHTLDSVTEQDGSPTTLTNLMLTGDTLTWDDNGASRSAQLEP